MCPSAVQKHLLKRKYSLVWILVVMFGISLVSTEPWRNLWRELYEEEFGTEETEKRIASQFDYPAPGWFSCLTLSAIVKGLKIVLAAKAMIVKLRPAHPYGVGAKGSARVYDNAADFLPENDFFKPGREFDLTIRHSTSSSKVDDDAMMGGRAAAIKFQPRDDVTEGSDVMDLLFLTGRMNLLVNLASFLKLAPILSGTDPETFKETLYGKPATLQGLIEFYRRAPESFTQMKYNNHTTYLLESKDGQKHYVRFRLVPDEVTKMAEESGLISEEDQRAPWNIFRREDETRDNHYLRKKFKNDLAERQLKYYLEIQVHPEIYTNGNSNSELFNVAKEWEETVAPRHRLVELTVTEALPDEETEKLTFTVKNRPWSFTYPEPKSKYDYNSIPYAREIIYESTQYWRNFKLF